VRRPSLSLRGRNEHENIALSLSLSARKSGFWTRKHKLAVFRYELSLATFAAVIYVCVFPFTTVGVSSSSSSSRGTAQRRPPLITGRRRNRDKEFVTWNFLGEESEHSSQDQLEVRIAHSRFMS
jgi:hypothetical protein